MELKLNRSALAVALARLAPMSGLSVAPSSPCSGWTRITTEAGVATVTVVSPRREVAASTTLSASGDDGDLVTETGLLQTALSVGGDESVNLTEENGEVGIDGVVRHVAVPDEIRDRIKDEMTPVVTPPDAVHFGTFTTAELLAVARSAALIPDASISSSVHLSVEPEEDSLTVVASDGYLLVTDKVEGASCSTSEHVSIPRGKFKSVLALMGQLFGKEVSLYVKDGHAYLAGGASTAFVAGTTERNLSAMAAGLAVTNEAKVTMALPTWVKIAKAVSMTSERVAMSVTDAEVVVSSAGGAGKAKLEAASMRLVVPTHGTTFAGIGAVTLSSRMAETALAAAVAGSSSSSSDPDAEDESVGATDTRLTLEIGQVGTATGAILASDGHPSRKVYVAGVVQQANEPAAV